jgi:hypothetical protein
MNSAPQPYASEEGISFFPAHLISAMGYTTIAIKVERVAMRNLAQGYGSMSLVIELT